MSAKTKTPEKKPIDYGAFCLLAVVLALLLFQAKHQWWAGHLGVDTGTFHARANHFLGNGTWAGMDYNEYQPGALWFFTAVAWMLPNFREYDAFLGGLWLVNCAIIALHFLLLRKHAPGRADLLFLALVAATGPILLYRFELLVSLLILWAWKFFERNQTAEAAALLGLAASTKMYPVVLLPLLLAELARRKEWHAAARAAGFFCAGLLLPVVFYVVYGGTLPELLRSLQVHDLKPIGLEGFWGNAIALIQYALAIPLRITPGYGVHGMSSDLPVLKDAAINLAWMILTGGTLALILWRRRFKGYADPMLAFLLVLTFVYFSKVVNPQYLWWTLSILPLVAAAWFKKKERVFMAVAAVASLALTQAFYPVYYTELLDWFHGTYEPLGPFLVLVARNVLLGAALVATYLAFLRKKPRA